MNQAKIEQVGSPTEVFHHPASEFVMEFLGQVNVFRGRLKNGRAVVGDVAFDYAGYARPDGGSDEHAGDDGQAATVYVRPHEMDIERSPSGAAGLYARVLRINPAGAVARIGLQTEDQNEISVDLPYHRFEELELKLGEMVFVAPKRVRVFAPEYSI
jgi:sulfate transport system ATP-binding protein